MTFHEYLSHLFLLFCGTTKNVTSAETSVTSSFHEIYFINETAFEHKDLMHKKFSKFFPLVIPNYLVLNFLVILVVVSVKP